MPTLKPKAPKHSYNEYMSAVKITDVLNYAGYRQNRGDGNRYPSYSRYDDAGKRIRGDKYVVSPHGTCFQPPEQRSYNIISFIKEHPHLFPDYRNGMNPDLLVNIVCRAIMGDRMSEQEKTSFGTQQRYAPFTFDIYDRVVKSEKEGFDFEKSKDFYRFFAHRGIKYPTMEAFAGNFMKVERDVEVQTQKDGLLSTEKRTQRNIAFPMTAEGRTVGLELRGAPYVQDGVQKSYKGMAPGSESSIGAWTANLSGVPLKDAKHVYWFESAYDAMAFYQLKAGEDPKVRQGVFVSSGGSLTRGKVANLLSETNPKAVHHLGFDADTAGRSFAVTFALVRDGRDFNTRITGNDDDEELTVSDPKDKDATKKYNMRGFDFSSTMQDLGVDEDGMEYMPPSVDYKDWNDQLLNKKNSKVAPHESAKVTR